jgi:Mg-chelatase subunit ChlD
MNLRVLAVVLLAISSCGCGRADRGPPSTSNRFGPSDGSRIGQIELPEVDQRLCTSVVLLIDTSPSMQDTVADGRGGERRKFDIAREVLQGVIDYTDQWTKEHPDRTLDFGVLAFSNEVDEVLPPAKFDRDEAEKSLQRLPSPGNGTAIGRALESGFRALYRTGCVRKYIVCITDGENTVSPDPAVVAAQLFEQTKGEVEIHFVAFDTSASHFAFLRDVNGYVVEAADGGQLEKQLSEIYEKRILAEAMPAEQP